MRYEIHIGGGGGGGGGTTVSSRFAPKYLVGNVPAGDSAVAYSAGGFMYIPDPGDGTGIATALAAAASEPGSVLVRRGTYTLGARLTVPAGIRVIGEGASTIIRSGSADHCAFAIGAAAQLADLAIAHPGTAAAAGAALIESAAGSATIRALLQNLMMTSAMSGIPFMSLVGGLYEIGSSVLSFTGAGAQPRGIVVEGAAGNPASFDVHDCDFSLLDVSVRFGFTGAVSVQDSRVMNCRFSLSNAVVPVQAGASSSTSMVGFCVSRGSGSVLPTDAGVGNSVNPGVANIWGA